MSKPPLVVSMVSQERLVLGNEPWKINEVLESPNTKDDPRFN